MIQIQIMTGIARTCCLTLFIVSGMVHLCYGTGEYSHTVYIDHSTGNDTESCITSNSPSVPCKSLNWAFLTEHRHNSTQYVLSKGKHLLNESVATFENLESIAFTGTDMNITIVECTTSFIGFAFVDVTAVEFYNLTFNSCSALRDSTTRVFNEKNFTLYQILVGLYFYHSHNVAMSHVTVSNSPYATGVVMYDTDGTVTITDSVFINNTAAFEGSDRLYPGGGGFYVEFSYCIPGDETCNISSDSIISHESRNKGAQYLFSGCIFSHNKANNLNDESTTYIIPYRSNHEAFGRGGGLSIFVKGNATSNSFNITKCHFSSNRALWGAGLFIEFHDNTASNTVIVKQSNFVDNECNFTTDSGTGGGGMRIGHYVYTNSSTKNSTVLLRGNMIILNTLVFDNNTALVGGGLSISPTLQAVGHKQIGNITVFNSTFTNNVARLGSAIHIGRFSLIINGLLLNISIEECVISNNSNDYVRRIRGYKYTPYQVGIGAVYLKNVDVSFKNTVLFFGNNGSALAAVGSSVDFSDCTALFQQNSGNNGAGIALLGAAYIQIDSSTSMYFFNNTATTEGGAIYNKYIERENLKTHTNCFIRHTDYFLTPDKWGANFTFFRNYHHNGHDFEYLNAIHATSILPCAWAGGSSLNSSSVFCWKGWHYIDHIIRQCDIQISTDVGEISFTQKEFNHVKAFPGIPFSLPFTIQGDLQSFSEVNSQTVFFASTTDGTKIGDSDATFTYVSGNSTTVKGAKNHNVNLQLDTTGDRMWHVEVVVELQPCPPGFDTSSDREGNVTDAACKCLETGANYNGALYCDSDSYKSFLKNNYWIGLIEDEYLVSQCPPGYCSNNYNLRAGYLLLHSGPEWNYTVTKLDDLICGNNFRSGVSCGECLEGYGPAVNSMTYKCIICNDTSSHIAKYVASIYIPLFFMFTVLILFDIRLTTGPANAFILYCQVVASTFDLNADGQIPLDMITQRSDSLLKAYRVVYGVFNLEFIENLLHPLCLGTHFNNLSIFLLDYAVALSPLLMVVLVILYVKLKDRTLERCQCCRASTHRAQVVCPAVTQRAIAIQRNISEAILPAFAAFILLSYTKFSITSSYLLRYQPLIKPNGEYDSYELRAYYAGQYRMSDGEYFLKYAFPAIIVIATFVLIPPLLLLDYPLRAFEWCISKVACLWRFYPVDKIHVFLDTFQGCYKNKMRFFAGLYFVFRLIVNVSYIFTNSWLEQFVVQQIACTVMIMLLAFCQPYNEENSAFNYVDTFIFTNLAALNILSLYMYSFSQSNALVKPPTFTFALQYFLVFLPLIYMLGYILWMVVLPKINQKLMGRTGYQPLLNVTRNFGTSTGTINSPEEIGTSTEIFARAELENTYRRPNPSNAAGNHGSTSNSKKLSEDSGVRSDQSNSSQPGYGSTSTTSQSNRTTID